MEESTEKILKGAFDTEDETQKTTRWVMDAINRHNAERAKLMPTEYEALQVMMEAYKRLKDLGWKEAIYCPKDGSIFLAIEAGSTGIGECSYDGEWPEGYYWMHEAGDLWPSRPILFKKKEED